MSAAHRQRRLISFAFQNVSFTAPEAGAEDLLGVELGLAVGPGEHGVVDLSVGPRVDELEQLALAGVGALLGRLDDRARDGLEARVGDVLEDLGALGDAGEVRVVDEQRDDAGLLARERGETGGASGGTSGWTSGGGGARASVRRRRSEVRGRSEV